MSVMEEIHRDGKKYIVLGNGSNTLIKDSGFSGVVVKPAEAFQEIRTEGERLICGSGALMSAVAKRLFPENLTGFEFASGIPGEDRGAVFMNAGAYGGEMKDIVESAELVSADGKKYPYCTRCGYGFRIPAQYSAGYRRGGRFSNPEA